MAVIGRLYSNDTDEQSSAIVDVLMGKYDDELTTVFSQTHGVGVAHKMTAELKDEYRKVLQLAIDEETNKHTALMQQEAAEKFMGNQEPHALGTTAELAERYNVSKKQIRKMKQDGTLEELIKLDNTE